MKIETNEESRKKKSFLEVSVLINWNTCTDICFTVYKFSELYNKNKYNFGPAKPRCKIRLRYRNNGSPGTMSAYSPVTKTKQKSAEYIVILATHENSYNFMQYICVIINSAYPLVDNGSSILTPTKNNGTIVGTS